MMEKQPQMLCSMQACFSAATSGPSRVQRMSGEVSIDRPCREYSGNTMRSIVGMLRRALPIISIRRWQARAAGPRRTEQRGGPQAVQRLPGGEDHQGNGHQALTAGKTLVPAAGVVERQIGAADTGKESTHSGSQYPHLQRPVTQRL